ncbi:hypothetical protein [Salipiger mucosus]|uniref:Uncharacterized protein n=1 Tax=Salipiger mucosus DSM 16094 TaxID=1123237 RepID=S9QRJ8_9RHOB|nr:hypothetical protein [Salipiger mucosus]EPX82258.1 hypothetical protein Salmuc_03045 [Salipiger mucosus DSM 16094]
MLSQILAGIAALVVCVVGIGAALRARRVAPLDDMTQGYNASDIAHIKARLEKRGPL